MLHLPPANDILGAMITPALLISASGTMVLSTSTRLGRVVDRVRVLADMAETLGGATEDTDEKRRLIHDQLGKLHKRIRRLVPAIRALYVAIGLLVASSISVGVGAVLGLTTAWLPVALGLLGACFLFYASTLLISEARLASDATLHEMSYVRRLVARRTGFGNHPTD